MVDQPSQPDLEAIVRDARGELERSSTQEALESWRVSYLGRRGRLTLLLRSLAALSLEERRTVGAEANRAKAMLEQLLGGRQQALKQATSRLLEAGRIDVTMPGRPVALGRLHPITQTVREICAAFVSMGFDVVEGPEVEWEHYNFDALNIPRDHPARDMWDTLWVDWTDPTSQGRRMLLRTHTSPMQARVMEKTRPPVRVVVPGRVYRYEASDATHEWHFTQVEGLAVDEHITFADMKGTLYEFARRIFGADRKVRFRCDYFPCVEPGAEKAIDCFACHGKGCRICKDTGWIEIMGAGMVHPRVLEGVGYDPSAYTGFAFGLGVERIAMLKYGIEDIRLFYANDVRFLRQF
ncbi:MAG: phenylalanine--tRNA ligase subunit alpha [Dehalococcoidia bacterium]|nr:phenylalanine--tRNA ligase subunit alpha [Dehalococcoidia bacterium]